MTDIGQLLKEKRLTSGISIDEVSEHLKIRTKYLQAIEENIDTPDIPSPVYMLGYIRTYADFMGFNGKAIVTQLRSQSVGHSELTLPESYHDDSHPNFSMLLWSLILMASIILFWYHKMEDHSYFQNDKQIITSDAGNIKFDHNYLLAKYAPNLEVNPRYMNLHVRSKNNDLIIAAKQQSKVVITDATGRSSSHLEMQQGELHLLPYQQGVILTISKPDSVDLFKHHDLISDS